MTPVFEELKTQITEAEPATERVGRLRNEYFTYRPVVCLERALSYTRSYRETEGLAAPLRRAYAFRRACEEKSVTILEDELIVGMPALQPRGGVFCPEIAWKMAGEGTRHDRHPRAGPLRHHRGAEGSCRSEMFPYWRGRSMEEYFLANLPRRPARSPWRRGSSTSRSSRRTGPGSSRRATPTSS